MSARRPNLERGLDIVVLGLSITSSWGNGHATPYRALVRALCERGHDVLFLERDVPWYALHRDLPHPPYGRMALYRGLEDLRLRFRAAVKHADLVITGSSVPDGADVARWVLDTATGVAAVYDLDTPMTLSRLATGDCDYLAPELVPRFDLYLSSTGGPTLELLEVRWGARRAEPLYCAVDPAVYLPLDVPPRWRLGYMGTYSEDRQPVLDSLLLEPARRLPAGRFCVAGPKYAEQLVWPSNVERIEHLPPGEHRGFYCASDFTLNVTRRDMIAAGYSPSVRLFEAAACGVPIISDAWAGLDAFFTPGLEILVARGASDVLEILSDLPEEERRAIAARARQRVLREHTAAHRAAALERYVREVRVDRRAAPRLIEPEQGAA